MPAKPRISRRNVPGEITDNAPHRIPHLPPPLAGGGGCSSRGADGFAHKRAARLESRSPLFSSSLSGSEPLPIILPDNLTFTEAKYKLGQHPQPFMACWAARPAKAAGLGRASKGS